MELYNNCFVLIESDWNLKVIVQCGENQRLSVLIESDWNLKLITSHKRLASVIVLIESDWNLKQGIAAYNGIGLRLRGTAGGFLCGVPGLHGRNCDAVYNHA